TGGQLIEVADSGALVSFDLSGVETGHTTIAGAHSLVGVAPRAEVLADPAQISDFASFATTLADLLSDDATRIQGVLGAANGQRVVVAGDVGATSQDVQDAIDNGDLSGATVETRPLVAVSSTSGIALLDAATLTQVRMLAT